MWQKSGHKAEVAVANLLKRRSHKIIELNWRNRFAEIDVITNKQNVIYFVEVKYRKDTAQGDGLDYITNEKLTRMHRAAAMYMFEHQLENPMQLMVASVSGQPPRVESLIEDIQIDN